MRYESDRFGENEYFEYAEHFDFSYPPHFHRSLEFIYLDSGKLTVIEPGRKTYLEPGESVFFLPNEPHSYESTGHSHYRSIVFSPEFVMPILKKIEGLQPSARKFILEMPDFKDSKMIEKTLTHQFKLTGILYIIFGNFMEQVPFEKSSGKRENLIVKIIDYIGRHYKEDIRLKQLADVLGYDPSYISRFMSENMNITFHRYVTNLRLSEAIYLLRSTDDTIASAALQVGFSSIRTFNHAFKQEFKTNPTEFLKRKTRYSHSIAKTYRYLN